MSRALPILVVSCCIVAACQRADLTTKDPANPSSSKTDANSVAVSANAAQTEDALPAKSLNSDAVHEPEQESTTGYPPVDKHFVMADSWTRLGKEELWIDRQRHQVIVGGHICLRAGPLEMFACPQHTKEHESIISTHTSAKFIHAALLAVGAKPGTPVQFDPTYKAATGPKVKITIRWMQDGTLVEKAAQDLVRDIRTRKPMQHDWLFVGSGTWKNPDTADDIYLADSGELVCVSNFGSATLDLPVESSSEAAGLLFEALSENIPDLGTLVLMVLEPEVDSANPATNSGTSAAGLTEKSPQTDPKKDQ